MVERLLLGNRSAGSVVGPARRSSVAAEAGLRSALVHVDADHLASRLTGAGFQVTILDEEELVAALATSVCADPLVTAEAGRTAPRSGVLWSPAAAGGCDDRRHTTYWVRHWPNFDGHGSPGEPGVQRASLPRFVALLTSLPALATTFSLTPARGDRREVSLTGHVRVTGRGNDELVGARRALRDLARQAGAGLVRLDREQPPGMLATLPLGGAR